MLFIYLQHKSRRKNNGRIYNTWNVRFVKGALKCDERNYFGIKIIVDNAVSYRADNFTSPIIVTGITVNADSQWSDQCDGSQIFHSR